MHSFPSKNDSIAQGRLFFSDFALYCNDALTVEKPGNFYLIITLITGRRLTVKSVTVASIQILLQKF
jgi:hypothetical protein